MNSDAQLPAVTLLSLQAVDYLRYAPRKDMRHISANDAR